MPQGQGCLPADLPGRDRTGGGQNLCLSRPGPRIILKNEFPDIYSKLKNINSLAKHNHHLPNKAIFNELNDYFLNVIEYIKNNNYFKNLET